MSFVGVRAAGRVGVGEAICARGVEGSARVSFRDS